MKQCDPKSYSSLQTLQTSVNINIFLKMGSMQSHGLFTRSVKMIKSAPNQNANVDCEQDWER